MIKKIIFLIICFLPLSVLALDINSSNAILYNLNNDEIIYEKNSEEKVKIASLTKIMTVILSIENIDNLDDKVVITYDMLKGLIEQDASVIGLEVGDVVTYRDLLYCAMLPSAADATQALAISIGGSVDNFVQMMNDKAKELGLKNTYYTNTSGLDYLDNHSTVKDVSVLLKYALNNDIFKEIFQTRFYTTTNGMIAMSTIEYSSNKYNLDTDYIIGAKTGTTDLAGLCLASITSYNDINYLLVTTGALYGNGPLNLIDANTIYNYYFNHYNYYDILKTNQVLLSIDNKYSNNDVEIRSSIDYSLYMLDDIYKNMRYEYMGKGIVSIFDKDKKIGVYNIILDDEIIKSIDIYIDDIEFSLFIFIKTYWYIFLMFGILILSVNLYKFKLK